MEFSAGYSYEAASLSPGQMIAVLLVSLVLIAAQWKLYVKAGKPGWTAIIPIYSAIVMYQIICGRGSAWLRLFIPIYNIYWMIKTYICLAHAYGKSTGFGIGLLFLGPIFMCILGFGDAQYVGPQDM